ncbi:MAG TPA: hypothetical protein ENN60_01695 [archaeon]|nr:hypothetical protein [archaeon]
MEDSALLTYYSRDDVATALVDFARNREVTGRFADGGYGRRPGTLMYPGDVVEMVKQGMKSFHCSVELWDNPMTLDQPKVSRKGWDFLIDLDCDTLDHGREAADILLEALKAHGVTSIFTKFSGRSGFHIFLPWQAFHDSLRSSFPEVPRAIGAYLEDFVADEMSKEVKDGVKIDSIAIAPRHLIRMPYSLNEKAGLVSIPVKDPWFDLETARPEQVKVVPFELRARPGEAMELAEIATSFLAKKQATRRTEAPRMEVKGRIEPQFFPPCIQLILKGMKDGKKRSEFILRNFLSSAGWDWASIEQLLLEWNLKNPEPLRPAYIESHIKWSRAQRENLPPPNCDRKEYYPELGICQPDDLCRTVSNPITYALKKHRRYMFARKEEERRQSSRSKKPSPAPESSADDEGSTGKTPNQG